MEVLQSVREKVVDLLGEVTDVEEAVVRAKRMYEGECYAMTYIDLADNVVGRANELHDFQERVLGDDFFGSPGDLRWNKYLYIVAGPNSLGDKGFKKAKALIESDKEYARKRVVSEDELGALLGAAQHFTSSTSAEDFNVVGEWGKRLAAADLDELLDRPARKDVIERIGTHSAKRVSIADRALTLPPADILLTQNWLQSISIDKFRPIHEGKSYSFGQVNLIVGPNGTGKTSLLEAIEYFYCGHNRRQGGLDAPKISGALAGHIAPLMASAEPGRIRARCFSWYNREERLAKSILSAFTRYNFLDTDAAFRLSTELEPSEISSELSRLLVGADASTIWDYLTKISPELDNAYERSIARVDENLQNLAIAKSELEKLQGRPSNSKTLTEAFRSALDVLRWKAPRATTPLATWEEADGLQEAISHVQAVLAAGSAAVSLDTIAARSREIDSALEKAIPLDLERTRCFKEITSLKDRARTSDHASQTLDRWLNYVNSGFSAAFIRLRNAKTVADTILGRIGVYANGELPVVPDRYASIPLDIALKTAKLSVRTAHINVTDLESLSANFGKAATARAEAARQLRAAALESFAVGHPMDDCPICRAKYAPRELAALVDKITNTLEQPSELTVVTDKLADARKNLELAQGAVSLLEFLQDVASAVDLPSDIVCAAVPVRVEELRGELLAANTELTLAIRDWKQLSNSGLTTNEHDQLRNSISKILNGPQNEHDVATITGVRDKLLEEAKVCRKEVAACQDIFNRVTAEIAEIGVSLHVDGWKTNAPVDGSLKSIVVIQSEIDSVANRINSLRNLMDVDGSASLAELSLGVVGADRIHSEAMQTIKIESSASEAISQLEQRIEDLSEQGRRASERASNYKSARDVLELLLKECSLERATQKSLDAIGSQINEIFNRIHSPKEYEYVGRDDVILQSAVTNEKRTLDQVSTGQRAAFALSAFLAMNRSATLAPPVILIDDPIAHIDDLNALSFLDYLRDLTVNSNRQIFFATADTRIASLFARKFGFLGDAFKTIPLARELT